MKIPKSLNERPRVERLLAVGIAAVAFAALYGVLGILTGQAPTIAYGEDIVADRTVEGVLQYTAPPDLTICFCGPFFVVTEKNERVYLASDEVDLSEHIHDKVSVTGKPYITACMGTLYQPCNFIRVASLELLSPTPTEPTTWGGIKSLFE